MWKSDSNVELLFLSQSWILTVLIGIILGFAGAYVLWRYVWESSSQKKDRLQKATDKWLKTIDNSEATINKSIFKTSKKLDKFQRKLSRATLCTDKLKAQLSAKTAKINELQLILGQTKKSVRTASGEVNRLKKRNEALQKEGCSKQELEWFQEKLRTAEARMHQAEAVLKKERERFKKQADKMQREYKQVHSNLVKNQSELEKAKNDEDKRQELENENKILQGKLNAMDGVTDEHNSSKAAVLAKLKSQAIEYKAATEKLSTDLRKQISETNHYKQLSGKLKNDLGEMLKRSFTMLRDARAKAALYKRQLTDLQALANVDDNGLPFGSLDPKVDSFRPSKDDLPFGKPGGRESLESNASSNGSSNGGGSFPVPPMPTPDNARSIYGNNPISIFSEINETTFTSKGSKQLWWPSPDIDEPSLPSPPLSHGSTSLHHSLSPQKPRRDSPLMQTWPFAGAGSPKQTQAPRPLSIAHPSGWSASSRAEAGGAESPSTVSFKAFNSYLFLGDTRSPADKKSPPSSV